MRAKRFATGLLPAVALAVLVVALGALQYRWLGQVSEAERTQLRELLEQRAQAFGEDFDRELAHAFRVFQAGAAGLDALDPEPIAASHDEWVATARFPSLVAAVYGVRVDDEDRALFRFRPDARQFEPAAWPTRLSHLRWTTGPMPAIDAALPQARRTVIASTALLAPEVPALLIPVPQRGSLLAATVGAERAAGAVITIHGTSTLVIELDRAYVASTMLPALIDRHFAEAERYGVTVTDAAGDVLMRRSAGRRAAPTDLSAADAAAPLFMLRPELYATGASGGGAATARGGSTWTVMAALPRDGPPAEGRTADIVRSGGSWHVLVQHAAGSLDAAVADVRRRNLWLNFGILAVLAAGVSLIAVNARRSERLAAQQLDFVATVSHELRTPVAVIRSAAQNLSAGIVHETAQASQYGALIESEGRRLTEMVEHVLEYAGLHGNGRPAQVMPVDCGALVRDVLAAQRTLIDTGRIDVQCEIEPDLPPVLADEAGIRRALHNLIGNAVTHAADGRWLGVSVCRVTVRGRQEVRMAVSDRGPGIASEDLGRIFEPFFRGRHAVARQVHGSGLGLSLVKRIAEVHGGRVTVRSAAGHGSTFTLHLPAAPPEAAAHPLATPSPGTGEPAR